MSISDLALEKLLKEAKKAKYSVKTEALSDGLLSSEQMTKALKTIGFSDVKSVGALKRTKQKVSAKSQQEIFEVNLNLPAPLNSIFNYMVMLVFVTVEAGIFTVHYEVDWTYVGGGRNGMVPKAKAISEDGGNTWRVA